MTTTMLIWLVTASSGCVTTSLPPVAQPAQAMPPPAAATETARELLVRLENAHAGVRDFQAKLIFEKWDAVLERREIRTGRLVFEKTKDNRRLGILLDRLIIGGRAQDRRKDWIFDGGWLIERDHEARLFLKRQIVAPGENFDPLKLGEGPFPLPVGQPAGEVLARFEVELLDKPSDDNLAARLAKVKTEGLLLRPRPATDLARDVERLELFYDTATLIPVGVQ